MTSQLDGKQTLTREKDAAFRAAKEAGAILKERLGKVARVDYKSAFNLVTDVDRASEEKVVEILTDTFPEYGILGEEGGERLPGKLRRWLIDPLDGTTNYAHSYPFFNVSIGLEENGRVLVGVVYNPIADELFWAVRGQGAWLNDRRISVSSVSSLGESLLATGFPPDSKATRENNMQEFVALTDLSHGVRRDGSAALDLCFVAAGRLDGFWEGGLSPWDVAAGSLIVEEAGGRVSNLAGGPLDIHSGDILSTNNLIHDAVAERLAAIKSKRSS